MNLNVGQILHGFKVVRIRPSKELGGNFIEMEHTGCGAQLIYMDNGESNKLFCVAFKTLPEDSTGVFHILEHSVLCGSKKYPVKEPFVDLMKSSMNTFLNAMTYSDKTVYPISSRNDRDFLNLTSVYLDAVFAPLSVIDENAFRQEGWHLETDENGKPFFNGVVYNEMKGAASSVDDVLYDGMQALLFPDNCYRFNSGGDPTHIPELTYEKYCELYHKYYHPSNARFFLDGAVPLDETLALISSYIGGAERRDSTHPIPMQACKLERSTLYYEIGADEYAKGKTMLSFGKLIGSFEDKRRYMMCEVLTSLLASTNESPLKRAILDKKLGENVQLYIEEGMQQHKLVLTVRNTEKENENAIRETVAQVVSELLEKGLDKQLLTAHLNKFAFRIKDIPEPAGLFFRCINSLNSSLYGGDPMLYLEFDAELASLREGVERGEFDELLKEMLDLDTMSTLTVLPSKTYGDELRKAEEARAKEMFSALSDEEKAELDKKNERLHAWQQEPDSEEKTRTLPVLPLSEVSPEPLHIPTEFIDECGVRIMYHRIPSNGIAHFNLYFAATDLEKSELSRAKLMTSVLTKLPTKRHSVYELQQLINTYIGKLGFTVTASATERESCTPYIAANFSVLEENAEKAFEIVSEILLETDFTEYERIREILLQLDERTKQYAITSGNALGITAVNSHYYSAAVVDEETTGISARAAIKKLLCDFDEEKTALGAQFAAIAKRTFASSRLLMSLISTEPMSAKKLILSLPLGEKAALAASYTSSLPQKLGIRIPAQVAFAEKGAYVGELTGKLKVAGMVISLSYLWSKVRVQGGAYGCSLRASNHGMLCAFSYRDPSPARTLEVYDTTSDFIKEFASGSEEIEKFIISTIGYSEPLMSPLEAGLRADANILNGITPEKEKKQRGEMLEAKKEELIDLIPVFDRVAHEGAVCVVGNEASLSGIEGLTVIDL